MCILTWKILILPANDCAVWWIEMNRCSLLLIICKIHVNKNWESAYTCTLNLRTLVSAYRLIFVRSSSFCRTCCVHRLFWTSETISVHTINCVCHSMRSMFRVLGIYNFDSRKEVSNAILETSRCFFFVFFFSINFYMNFPMLLTFMIKFKTTFIKLLAKKR